MRDIALPLQRFMTAPILRSTLVGIGSLAVLVAMTGCPNKARQDSIDLSNSGNQALKKKEFEEADNFCKQATERFRDNNSAWWCLGVAKKGKADWAGAADAFEQAVRVDGKQPMYHMWLGIALYEKAVRSLREDVARREGKSVDQVKPDYTTLNADQAIQQLQEAVKQNGELYEAYYQLGRIFRDQEKSKEAAEALTKAIALNPRKAEPYIALSELYMRWDYMDQAVQVAAAGAGAVQAPAERATLEYELGLAYFNKRLDDKAVEAFSKALESKKDLRQAKFQRGSAYFRKGDFVNAKKDLEEFSKNGGTAEFEKNQATHMLADIAAKQH